MLELSDSYTGKGGKGGGRGSGGGRGRGRSGSSGVTSTLRRQVQAAQFVAAAPLVYDSSNASTTRDGLNRLPLVRNQGECSTCVGMVSACMHGRSGCMLHADPAMCALRRLSAVCINRRLLQRLRQPSVQQSAPPTCHSCS